MLFSQVFVTTAMAVATVTAIDPDSGRHSTHKPLREAQSNSTHGDVSTIFGTATLTMPVTILTTFTPSVTAIPAEPTYTATQLYAYREDSPIHLLPIQARGLYFQLGGLPATVCPSFVEDCPPGILTGINNCELVSTFLSDIL